METSDRIESACRKRITRFRSCGAEKVALHSDGGRTWPRVYLDETLITPCCQDSSKRFTKKADGHARNRLLFSNPAHTLKRIN